LRVQPDCRGMGKQGIADQRGSNGR
jgi:hypothetical protein